MRRFFLRLLLAVVLAIVAVALFLGVQLHTGNFHEVLPGELYRSAQPTGADIERYVKRYGIKTVLNLRGGNPLDAWYNEEIRASKALGVTQLDFRIKAARELTDEQITALIEVMRNAPKPMLIHCNAGADRSGLAAAFYLAAIHKTPLVEANRQLSLRYGHLPFWWIDAQAMDRTLERAQPLLVTPAP